MGNNWKFDKDNNYNYDDINQVIILAIWLSLVYVEMRGFLPCFRLIIITLVCSAIAQHTNHSSSMILFCMSGIIKATTTNIYIV